MIRNHFLFFKFILNTKNTIYKNSQNWYSSEGQVFLTLKKVSSHRIMNPWIPLADSVVNLNISSKNKCNATKFIIFSVVFALNFPNDEEIRTNLIFEKSLFCKNLININRRLLIVSHKGLVSLRISLTVMVYLSIVIWKNDKKLTQFLVEPIYTDRYVLL